MEGCDTLFMVGTNFPYTKYLPEPGQCKVVQIEADPIRAGNRIADRGADDRRRQGGLSPLCCRISPKSGSELSSSIAQTGWPTGGTGWHALESIDGDPIQPQYLMHVIDRLAGNDAILTSDSGTIATWAARHFTIRGDREFYLSGNLATMAPGLPYTIANQIAHPGRQCIAFVGDGGFAMLMAEFATACRYDLPIKVVVNNNASLGQIMWEQLVLGLPRVRRPLRPTRPTLPRGPRPVAGGASGSRRPTSSRVPSRRRWPFPGPALVDVPVNPTSRRCRARSATSRPRAFSRPSWPVSPERPPSPAPCSGTRSTEHTRMRLATHSACDAGTAESAGHARRHRPSAAERPPRSLRASLAGLTARRRPRSPASRSGSSTIEPASPTG